MRTYHQHNWPIAEVRMVKMHVIVLADALRDLTIAIALPAMADRKMKFSGFT